MTKYEGRATLTVEGSLSDRAALTYEPVSHPDPFQILVAEHALLRQDMERAVAAARKRGASPGMDRRLEALASRFRLHTRREDRVVVPVCERLFGGKDGAAAVMREEHGAITEGLHSLSRDRVSPEGLQERIARLKTHVETHFAKEERVLFPLMAALLSNPEASALARRLRSVPDARDEG